MSANTALPDRQSAQHTNAWLKAIVQRTRVDTAYAYRADELIAQKIRFLADHCERILDVGKSSREHYRLFKNGQALTTDINRFEDYPDVVDDICQPQHLRPESFDGIVCMAVLEHVYEPHAAVHSLHRLLRPGGYCFLYAPFIYRYHAPADLHYQDFFRYTRDGFAYLLRDFTAVTLYPCLGRYSTAFHLFSVWKHYAQRLFGQRLNRLIDRLGSLAGRSDSDHLQASGFYAWAVK